MGRANNDGDLLAADNAPSFSGIDLLRPFGLEKNEGLAQAIDALLEDPPLPGEEPHFQRGEAALSPSSPAVVGLSGEAQSGKDAVAEYIFSEYKDVEKLAISDSVIAEANEILAPAGVVLDQTNKSLPLARRVLQELGLGRVQEDRRYWCYKVEKIIRRKQSQGARLVLITGVRTLEEKEFFGEMGAPVWKVERPGNTYKAEHAIESEIRKIEADQTLQNDTEGDMEPLFRQADELLAG